MDAVGPLPSTPICRCCGAALARLSYENTRDFARRKACGPACANELRRRAMVARLAPRRLIGAAPNRPRRRPDRLDAADEPAIARRYAGLRYA
jgi:hypothetical protein